MFTAPSPFDFSDLLHVVNEVELLATEQQNDSAVIIFTRAQMAFHNFIHHGIAISLSNSRRNSQIHDTHPKLSKWTSVFQFPKSHIPLTYKAEPVTLL